MKDLFLNVMKIDFEENNISVSKYKSETNSYL